VERGELEGGALLVEVFAVAGEVEAGVGSGKAAGVVGLALLEGELELGFEGLVFFDELGDGAGVVGGEAGPVEVVGEGRELEGGPEVVDGGVGDGGSGVGGKDFERVARWKMASGFLNRMLRLSRNPASAFEKSMSSSWRNSSMKRAQALVVVSGLRCLT
jgi:hypothetical protein